MLDYIQSNRVNFLNKKQSVSWTKLVSMSQRRVWIGFSHRRSFQMWPLLVGLPLPGWQFSQLTIEQSIRLKVCTQFAKIHRICPSTNYRVAIWQIICQGVIWHSPKSKWSTEKGNTCKSVWMETMAHVMIRGSSFASWGKPSEGRFFLGGPTLVPTLAKATASSIGFHNWHQAAFAVRWLETVTHKEGSLTLTHSSQITYLFKYI